MNSCPTFVRRLALGPFDRLPSTTLGTSGTSGTGGAGRAGFAQGELRAERGGDAKGQELPLLPNIALQAGPFNSAQGKLPAVPGRRVAAGILLRQAACRRAT
jgi:hypothetical protein